MAKEYEIHPLCADFPDLSDEDLKRMADDIAVRGQKYPIIRWNKQILDGKNRLKACGIAGIQPTFEEWYPTTPSDPEKSYAEAEQYVDSLNEHRRHLTTSQRSFVAAARAKRKPGQSHANLPSTTIAQAAADMHVSPRSVQEAKAVLANGSPELKDAVRNGVVSVSDAASVADLPAAEQKAAVKAVKSGKAKTAAKAANKKPAKKMPAKPKEREPGDETENDVPDWTQIVPKHLHPVAGSLKEIRSAIIAIGRVKRQISDICESPGGLKMAKLWSDMERMCEQISVNLKSYRFFAACPECKITDKQKKAAENCKMCRGHGWIAKPSSMTDAQKAWLKEQGVNV